MASTDVTDEETLADKLAKMAWEQRAKLEKFQEGTRTVVDVSEQVARLARRQSTDRMKAVQAADPSEPAPLPEPETTAPLTDLTARFKALKVPKAP